MADPKEAAAQRVQDYIRPGMVVGLGSGSTAAKAIRLLGGRVQQGLAIRAIPTSRAAASLAAEYGIELTDLEEVAAVDLTFDGADEVDPALNLVKGLGGALLREKVVASVTHHQLILVDPGKLVPRLGTRAPVPVEVVPFARAAVARRLEREGHRVELCREGDGPFVTDNGNHILHCWVPAGIPDPAALDAWLNALPGVVGHGLFIGLAHTVIVGQESGDCRLLGRS
ncbi:MAG: ribose-5-phosphate isomerase RpiA [Candidatus Latescibacterota bacterium]